MTALTTMPPIPRHIVIKHENDCVELSNSHDNGNSKPTVPLNLPLVDEIDLQQCLISPSQPWRASSIQGVVIGKEQLEVICKATNGGSASGNNAAVSYNHTSINGIQACPCCRRYIQLYSRVNVESGDDAVETSQQIQHAKASQDSNNNNESTFTSLMQAAVTTLTMQPTLMQAMAAPPLVMGDELQDFTITETIVQGWLYKKGTGGDFSGRRWWKPRWVTLALAETPNAIIPAPILLAHRAPGVPYPANIMELTESTVIMAIERTHETSKEGSGESSRPRANTPTKEEWNRHCFQIVHTHHQNNTSTPNKTTTRIFTAPVQDRNEWVFAMNNALMSYEKRLSKARTDAAKNENKQQQTKKARHLGSLLDDEEEQQQQQRQDTPWTINDDGRATRMRSPSPMRTASNASLGLPPKNPRRMMSPGRRVRSPSPIRMVQSSEDGSLARSISP